MPKAAWDPVVTGAIEFFGDTGALDPPLERRFPMWLYPSSGRWIQNGAFPPFPPRSGQCILRAVATTQAVQLEFGYWIG